MPNLRRLAASLGVTPPTLYEWIYQLDLTAVAGVNSKDAVDGLYSKEERVRLDVDRGQKYVKTQRGEERTLGAVTLAMAEQDLRMQRSVLITDSRWTWAKHRAVDAKKTTSEIVEEALDLLRQREEMPATSTEKSNAKTLAAPAAKRGKK
jgi:hypothetical protein